MQPTLRIASLSEPGFSLDPQAAQSAHSLVVEAEPPAQALAQAEEEEAGGGSSIEAMKANKRKHHLEMQEGIALFNTKPSKGIAFLQQQGKVRGVLRHSRRLQAC